MVESNNRRRLRTRTFIEQKLIKSTASTRGEVARLTTKAARMNNLNGKMAEVSLTAVISTLRVRIPRGGHIRKLKRKKPRKTSFIDSITKSTTSNKVSSIKVPVIKKKTRGTTKTAISTSSRKQGSVKSPSQKSTPSMNRKRILCSTSSTVATTSGI